MVARALYGRLIPAENDLLPSKQDIVGSSPIARSLIYHGGQKACPEPKRLARESDNHRDHNDIVQLNSSWDIKRARGAVVSAGDS